MSEATHNFLTSLPLPLLKETHKDFMNQSITCCEEIQKVIKKLALHKSPGPDGLPKNYYKMFSEQLIPDMTLHFNYLALFLLMRIRRIKVLSLTLIRILFMFLFIAPSRLSIAI